MITKETLIEDLVRDLPAAVGYMMDKGIKCIACGEPIWGTLERAALEKGFTAMQIDEMIAEINLLPSRNPS